MAAGTNRNRKSGGSNSYGSRNRRPPSQRGVEGNLARKPSLQEQVEIERAQERARRRRELEQERYRQREEAVKARRARQRAMTQAALRAAQRISPAAIFSFAGVALLMLMILACYIQLNAISRNIVDMKSQIEELRSQQVSLLAQYEQAFDLTSVKEKAEAAGMTQPSDSQIYYIDLPGEDQAVSLGDGDVGPLVKAAVTVKRKAQEILEYFQEYFQ